MDRQGRFAARTIRQAQLTDNERANKLPGNYSIEIFTDCDYDQGAYVRLFHDGLYGPADTVIKYVGSHSDIARGAWEYGDTICAHLARKVNEIVTWYVMDPKLFPMYQDGFSAYFGPVSYDF